MVLFLFVVMMLDIRIDAVRHGFWKHFPLAALIGALVAFEMVLVLMTGFRGVERTQGRRDSVNAAGQVVPLFQYPDIGQTDLHQYLYPVESLPNSAGGHRFSAIALYAAPTQESSRSDVTAPGACPR